MSRLSNWLGMPESLRNEQSEAIVKRWMLGTLSPSDNWTQFISGANDTKIPPKASRRAKSDENAPSEASVSDPKVQGWLEQARTMKPYARREVYSALYDYLEEQVNIYKETILYAGQKTGSVIDAQQVVEPSGQVVVTVTLPAPAEAALVVDNRGDLALAAAVDTVDTEAESSASSGDMIINRVLGQWSDLADTIRASAERIWRDLFLDPAANPMQAAPQMTLEFITRISQLLMLLWLETVLYQDRAYSNYTGRSMARDRGQSTRKLIREHVRKFRDALRRWDTELQPLRRANKDVTYFRTHRLTSQQFRRLIRQFSELNGEELGWASQVSDAQAELVYQQRDELRREYRAENNWLRNIGMIALKWTTGYGTKPENFAITALVVWIVDSIAFFVNDYFHNGLLSSQHFCAQNQPHIQYFWDYGLEALRYLYIAITNLTALGVNTSLATYCGGVVSEVTVLITTIFGYFMLGLLSAVLYTQLTQRD